MINFAASKGRRLLRYCAGCRIKSAVDAAEIMLRGFFLRSIILYSPFLKYLLFIIVILLLNNLYEIV